MHWSEVPIMRFLAFLLPFLFCQPVSATTIVWDGKYLACDTQASYGHSRATVATKIVYSPARQEWMGFAGDLAFYHRVKSWFLNSKSPISDLKGDFGVVVVNQKGVCRHYGGGLSSYVEIEGPFAIGSGSEYALGAVCAGRSAKEAVQIASHLDIYTNDRVIIYKVRK
jgi:ATP-dependent protease HslVU (ClpYQ) peptidase subunit